MTEWSQAIIEGTGKTLEEARGDAIDRVQELLNECGGKDFKIVSEKVKESKNPHFSAFGIELTILYLHKKSWSFIFQVK